MKMKIPNGSSGNGYYGHEGNVISYGDNEVHQMEPTPDSDFSEYMWMENEEEFDKEVSLSIFTKSFYFVTKQ